MNSSSLPGRRPSQLHQIEASARWMEFEVCMNAFVYAVLKIEDKSRIRGIFQRRELLRDDIRCSHAGGPPVTNFDAAQLIFGYV